MNQSNLPTNKSESVEVGINYNRVFAACSLIAILAAFSVYLLTQHIFISFALAVAAIGFFAARQLVQKSLNLTSAQNHLLMGSVSEQLAEVKKQVGKCKYLENVETEGVRASSQAEQLLQQYTNLKKSIEQKFESSELTYSRYMSGIDESCLSIAENLIHIKSLLENLNITKKNRDSDWSEQQSEVVQILNTADEALRGLASLYNSVTQITTKEKHRDQLEESMRQIAELAVRAKNYSKN